MLVINLFGASCVGKSTHASILYGELKKAGYRVELVREYCKNFFYEETQYKLDNQMLITGKQIEQTEMFRRGGCDIVVTDSPILLGALYTEKTSLADAIRREHFDNNNYNIMLWRDIDFNSFARGATSENSDKIFKLLQSESFTRHHVYRTSKLTDYSEILLGIETHLERFKENIKHEQYTIDEQGTKHWEGNGSTKESVKPKVKCSHPKLRAEFYAVTASYSLECPDCKLYEEIEPRQYLNLQDGTFSLHETLIIIQGDKR